MIDAVRNKIIEQRSPQSLVGYCAVIDSGHATMLFANWLNYYVYQVTPYNIRQIPEHPTETDF
jgi:hypothetical protein